MSNSITGTDETVTEPGCLVEEAMAAWKQGLVTKSEFLEVAEALGNEIGPVLELIGPDGERTAA